MKRNMVCRMLMNLSIPVMLATLLPTAHGQSCSLARAAGQYGFSDSGTIVNIGSRAATGLLVFDTAGNMSGVVTATLNGSVSETTASGTYTVNPDCSGSASFGEFDQSGHLILTATAAVVWDDTMREARWIFTSLVLSNGTPLSTVISGNARKLGGSDED